MVDYLNAECYKVLRRRYTYGALAALLGCVLLLMSMWWFINRNGGSVNQASGLFVLTMLMSVGLYAPLITTDVVFSEQYKIGTLKNEVSFGMPRSRIYLGKLAVALLVSLVACALALGLYLGLCALTLPVGTDPEGMIMAETAEMWQAVGHVLLSALPLWIGAQGVSYLCMAHIKGGVSGPFLAVFLIAGVPMALKLLGLLLDPVFFQIRAFTLVAPMDAWDQPLWLCWAIGMSWFLVSTLIGLILFQRRELN